MQRDRNIRKSVMALVRNLFQSPVSGSGLNAYTVYNEDDLRDVASGALKPLFPRVFLVDSYIRPTPTILPLTVVEVPETVKRPFEIGNVNGRRTEVALHVFGRMRGERDDLSSYLADNIGRQVGIYDYSSGSSGTFVEWATVEDQITIRPTIVNSDELRFEGSLDLWKTVTFFLLSKT